MLKKFLIGTLVVAGFAVMAASASADCSITTTLKVGSKGAEVSCLQTKVGATSDGSFGPLTKASVMAYQANHGLSSDGVVGPKSRAVLNGSPVASTTFAPAGCTSASGYSPSLGLAGGACHAVAAEGNSGCQAGFLFNPATGLSCTAAPVVNSTSEGSLAVSYYAVPANSTSLLKGANTAALAYELKATGSDMKITRLYVNLTTGTTISPRIWLAADTVTLLDGSTVIATLPLSASTVTEVTAGSEYQLQFNGLNVVVPVNTTKILTMKINRPTLTTSSTGTINIATLGSSFRAIDGAGITDTYAVTATRVLSFSATTSATGTLTNTLSASSPAAQSISGLSATAGVTTAIKLMDFDLKGTDGAVNVTDITGTIATTAASTCTVAKCVASVELRDGATVLSSIVPTAVTSAASTYDFSALNINVPIGTKTLSVWANVNDVNSGSVVAGDGITAVITNVTGTSGDTYATADSATDVTGNTQYLFQYAPTLTLGAVSAVQADESTSGTTQKGANYSIAFTVTAPAGSDIYVATASTALVHAYNATNAVGTTKTTAAYGAEIVTSSSVSGVSSVGAVTAWDKVAAGTSRTFTITGYVAHGTAPGYVGMMIAGIKWNATDAASSAISQIWGLTDFKTNSIYVTL